MVEVCSEGWPYLSIRLAATVREALGQLLKVGASASTNSPATDLSTRRPPQAFRNVASTAATPIYRPILVI
jgi:hypothetical protein